MPTIGKPEIRFQVYSGDPSSLYVADYSNWLTLETRPAVISITLPGSSTPIVYSFSKRTINEYNSNTLYQECGDCDFTPLEDGIYTITVKSTTPYELTKYYLKMDVIQLELDKMVIDLGLNYDRNKIGYLDEYFQIKFFMDAAEANLRDGDIQTAQNYFQYVQKLISKNCKTCH